MSDTQQLTGPDFTLGVPVDSLAPGDKVLGHGFGDAVLLARVGDEYFAVGATCSHYGGPLAEGVVSGDTVRCPWHHACFSLRTGEALRAPALNPVACYTVTRHTGTIRVTGKTDAQDPLAPTFPIARRSSTSPAVVIIGAGAAGSAAAEMLRRCGHDGSITVVDADVDAPYDRPNLSKDYLAGNAPEEWIPIRPSGFHDEHDIQLVRSNAERIDVAGRTVHLKGGRAVRYNALILATGAEPIHLGIPGDDLPRVHYLRSLADSRSIIAAAQSAKRAVVIGASFIGLEVAASLRTRGLDVHVVAPEKLPLERVLGAHLGAFVRSLHEEHGVQFHLERKPARIEPGAVLLDDNTRLDADLIVIGVGVRPRLALAESAGLTMDRGVVVNEFLQTSAPNVYAVGDIARFPDARSGAAIRVEHWVVAQRMGQAAARNILGAHEPFSDVPFFWSAHYDVSINYVGHAEQWDTVAVDGDAGARDVTVRYEKNGVALAVATIFRDQESLAAELEMEQRAARSTS